MSSGTLDAENGSETTVVGKTGGPPMAAIPARLLAASFQQPDYLVPLLERGRLITRLDDARRCRLIEIRAPTGCGKTTLLYQWRGQLCKRGAIAAWLGILRQDLDTSDLLASVGWALHIAGMSEVPRDLLEATPDQIDTNRCMLELLAQIAATQVPVVIMIDDFHLLRGAGPLSLIDSLLAGAPPNLRIAIATRQSPGLSVAGLQARGLTHTVATQELLFSSAEAQAILSKEMGPKDAELMMEHTAGWPIAVQLARLWFQQLAVRDRNLLEFPRSNGDIASFLTNEVIGSLDDELRSFLIDTSILSRINPALADAVRDRRDSKAILARLRSLAPLLMPIEGTEDIYKLHPLLAEQLSRCLYQRNPGRFLEMHRAAARALASADDLLNAVRHAKLADDPTLANSLIAEREPVTECLLRGPAEIRPCLALLADREWEENPHVWLARIFLSWRDSRFAEAEQELHRLRAKFPEGDQQFVRDLVIVRVVLSRCEPDSNELLLEDCRRELALAGAHNGLTRALLMTLSAISGLQAGNLNTAQTAIREALAFYEHSVAPIFILHGQLHAGWIAAVRGDLDTARDLLERICRASKRFGSAERGVRTLARAYIMSIEYERARLTFSNADMVSFFDDLRKVWCWFDFFVTAAKVAVETAFASDGAAAALTMVARMRSALAALALGDTTERVITAFEAGILARAGEPEGALERLACVTGAGAPVRTWYEFDALMFATGVAHIGTARGDEALEFAKIWEDRASREGRRPAVCRAVVLAALALWSQGMHDSAIAEMQRAIDLAIRDRLFAPFLEHMADQNSEIEALLQSGATTAESLRFAADLQRLAAGDSAANDVLRSLSGRECEVLDALCRHDSNKLIGRSLGVSEHAVKFHLKNIFRKLGVHSRAEAVARHAESQASS
jgi:LuxR family transcriptional regulator, maltose regulon positive regulatory protein